MLKNQTTVNCNAFSFDWPHRFDIVLFQYIALLIKLDGKMSFLYILSIFARLQVNAMIAQYCGNLSKVVVVTLFNIVGQTSQPQFCFLDRWDGNFECGFWIKYGR